jgi:hypothetical protein
VHGKVVGVLQQDANLTSPDAELWILVTSSGADGGLDDFVVVVNRLGFEVASAAFIILSGTLSSLPIVTRTSKTKGAWDRIQHIDSRCEAETVSGVPWRTYHNRAQLKV